jgi:hypothetical protein
MSPIQPVGSPIVVQSQTALCDKLGNHELTLLTDGFRAYAFGGTTDAAYIALDQNARCWTVTCGQPDAEDEPCTGESLFQMVEGTWRAPTDAELRLLEESPWPS